MAVVLNVEIYLIELVEDLADIDSALHVVVIALENFAKN